MEPARPFSPPTAPEGGALAGWGAPPLLPLALEALAGLAGVSGHCAILCPGLPHLRQSPSKAFPAARASAGSFGFAAGLLSLLGSWGGGGARSSPFFSLRALHPFLSVP
eukprot:CAMPEP_0181261360 /NCGR_PEP_ID=MMETSP1097-20121128/1460_1 /TAXON_ID=35684 /ORGANISM="Pseudopedinella elastica, Strain CCMP716" /LENGTH=108 /DNA_ID=CAMNT_0023359985 /DNA_START=365 /DNA_END=687 /DNA_ORIENTATION=+